MPQKPIANDAKTAQKRHKLLLASAPNLRPMTTKRLEKLGKLLASHPVFGPYIEHRSARFQKKSEQD